MKTATITGFVLGSKNLGENDKTIFIYNSELGKIKAIAKGCRKITSKFTGHLETLNKIKGSIYFGPRNIIITEITSSSAGIIHNFQKLKSKLQIAEITNQLIFENQTIEGLCTLLETTLRELNNSQNTTLITLCYIIKFLDKTGIVPDFTELSNNKDSRIEDKYLKFINYAKTETFDKLKNIQLTETEEKFLKKIISLIIERETGTKYTSLQI